MFDINQPPSKLSGKLQRFMLEIRPGTFVGKIPHKTAISLWDEITSSCRPAIGIISEKSEQGYSVKITGEKKRMPVDNYGATLIAYYKSAEKDIGNIVCDNSNIIEESVPCVQG